MKKTSEAISQTSLPSQIGPIAARTFRLSRRSGRQGDGGSRPQIEAVEDGVVASIPATIANQIISIEAPRLVGLTGPQAISFRIFRMKRLPGEGQAGEAEDR